MASILHRIHVFFAYQKEISPDGAGDREELLIFMSNYLH